MIRLSVSWVEKPVHRLFCVLGPGSQTQADAIGMGYDLAVEIALSAPPGFIIVQPSLQESVCY